MNARTLFATSASAEGDMAAVPAPEAAPADNAVTAKMTGLVDHPLETPPPGAPSSSRQADLDDAGATLLDAPEFATAEHAQRISLWARIARKFHRTVRRTPEHAAERDHRMQPGQPATPHRLDFIADAAMAREMFRL